MGDNGPLPCVALALQVRGTDKCTRISRWFVAFMAGGNRMAWHPESVANLPSLLLVPILWYWVGSSLDRRWEIRDKTPWIALLIFTVVCLIGAFIRTGYTSFLFPYGVTVWLIAALVLGRIRRRSQIIKQVNC